MTFDPNIGTSGIDAIAHNTRVERERVAEHLRLCGQSESYKRVYERYQNMNKELCKQFSEVLLAANNPNVSCNGEPVKPMESAKMDDNTKSIFFFTLAAMFADEEKQRQLKEDIESHKIMAEVNRKYDKRIICKSGFEW